MSDKIAVADGQIRKRSTGVLELQDDKGRRRTVQLDELNDADQALAAEFGYKPVFKREFGYLSTFSFAVSISGLFSTVTTTFIYGLDAGGAASAVWCWLISGAGCMTIALSVAELVSAYPTSGGLYFTVSRLAPKKWVAPISWVVGWLNLLGQVAGVASSEYGSAQLLLAAVSMSTGTYVPTDQHTVGVMAALTLVCGLVNSLSTYWMEKMTKGYVIFHVVVLVTCSIAILAKTAGTEWRNDATYVFTDITSFSGWTPISWSFLFGFLSVSWTMTDYDATAHITEEISEPELKAPWAISLAMAFTYIAGWLFTVVLAFCMGDLSADNSVLNTTFGNPVAQIYYNALGPAGGVFFTVCAFIIIQFVCFTATQSLGRTIFAFSRDRLLPFSNVWTKVNRFTGTPLYAVWIAIFWCILINLIGLGSYTAILGVFNVTAIALDISYCIPIACKLLFTGKDKPFQRGPWHLGKFSWFINLWACIWTTFVTIIFIMPTAIPVTGDTMNYALVFLAAILLASIIFWYTGGRKYYTGPIAETEISGQDGEDYSTGDDVEQSGLKHAK